ncbi:MAG: helix-turn-helix transcriptional regulator [Candidatus Aminicenantes bacterium]|nr:helix-turn-helix transcriptional regulator [Candidatus Aminicenantes bacterium]
MRLKNRLKEWRAKRDVSQQQLADAIGMSRQTINSIERGKFVPSILSVIKIARFFTTSIENLFYVEEEK